MVLVYGTILVVPAGTWLVPGTGMVPAGTGKYYYVLWYQVLVPVPNNLGRKKVLVPVLYTHTSIRGWKIVATIH